VQNSSAHSAGNGMPGIAISPTAPIQSTSQAIMTRRRALPGLSPKLGPRLGRHWLRSPWGIGQVPRGM
jgi:hypothetical protein